MVRGFIKCITGNAYKLYGYNIIVTRLIPDLNADRIMLK